MELEFCYLSRISLFVFLHIQVFIDEGLFHLGFNQGSRPLEDKDSQGSACPTLHSLSNSSIFLLKAHFNSYFCLTLWNYTVYVRSLFLCLVLEDEVFRAGGWEGNIDIKWVKKVKTETCMNGSDPHKSRFGPCWSLSTFKPSVSMMDYPAGEGDTFLYCQVLAWPRNGRDWRRICSAQGYKPSCCHDRRPVASCLSSNTTSCLEPTLQT